MDQNTSTKPREAGSSWLIMAAIWIMGAGLLVIGVNGELHRWSPPPVPPASANRPLTAPGDGTGAGRGRRGADAPLSRSVPVSLRIPAIGVNARVIPLGLTAGGSSAC